MNLIEPHRFTPLEAGSPTSVTLPGLHRNTHVDVMRINTGLVLAHSHFSAATRHEGDIRRPEDQLILAFNLSGRMLLIDPQGAAHEISGGEGWIIRSGGRRLQRIVEKGDGCSNLVIALSVSRLPPALAESLEPLLPQAAPFRRLCLPVPGKSMLETLLDGRTDPAALLRKEGQCLALIGHALEEIAAAPDHGPATGDPGLLIARVTAFLSDNLANPITISGIAQEMGMSHVTLNQIYRAATGMTVFQHLRSLRLEAAERLIRHTDRSFTEIAGECGFSDASHLSNAFRKRHDMTASDWRRQVRKKT
ncbi:AraC family transcriptional regulator [Rhodovulum sulfidophilum]|uniref:Helix-turn-helix transcriptional regulator n=1 Tax=Rhodovulum sulfidophilum TaxID=35806 RepID=A0ABS1RP79_RHOSU|nr:AraC family transcriptional regulator [Rhodovulum sulfidophilum]MBL3585612.1 helix-turn-helix transcriptional regulator [Rhodovulum sulfidophilum]MBL3607877.1 helix-turn-helix transcriptional regulator [Rhodovulum sulfidophilum]MCE8455760.1 AraC family transcriptional regulator [Rhodovulum sulfidophilum]